MLRVASIAAGLGLLLSVSPAQEKPAGQNFSSGEVIIKFSGRGKAAELSARAVAEGNPSDEGLSSYIKSVSSEVGVPLEVKRFGSGGNVIVAVREPELVANLLKRLRDNPSIESAHVISQQRASVATVEVNFREGTPGADALARAADANAGSSDEVQAITEKLEQYCRVPLTARVGSPRQFLLTPDLQRLTLDLAARLSKRPDVEYAQPNFIRRPTSANSEFQPPK
jgi:hypothetical protein